MIEGFERIRYMVKGQTAATSQASRSACAPRPGFARRQYSRRREQARFILTTIEAMIALNAMVLAIKNSRAAWATIAFIILLAIAALPLQRQYDGLSVSSGILIIAPVKPKTVPPQQKDKIEVVSVAEFRDQSPKIDPSLLRIDFKQNLLVWPNVAGDLTRSPPSPASVRSFS
jgi:hypothetical protein